MAATKTLARGVSWNLASFAVIGISGLAINLLIARFYEPWVLGVFNFVLAVFIFGGQIGAFAIQYSVLYHTPRALARSQGTIEILSSALLLSAAISAAVTLTVIALSGWLASTFDSPAAGKGLALSAVGLFFFPLNKILLAYLNGKGEMRLYAMGNAARSLIVVASVAAFVVARSDGSYIAVSLAIAEVALFLWLVTLNRRDLGFAGRARWRRWCCRHIAFGSRGVLGGILFELNTRVDVLALAFLADMNAVGIYSMASIFAEGLFQLLIVLRYNYDPLIARLVAQSRQDELRQLVRSGKRLAYGGMFIVAIIAVLLYPYVVALMVQRADYDASWLVFGILAGGILLSAGYVPFSGTLQQAGFPADQSIVIGVVTGTNLLGNILLVPPLGVAGAAAATAVSQVGFVFVLTWFVRRRLGPVL